MLVYEEDKQRWLWEEITWIILKRREKIWKGYSSPASHLELRTCWQIRTNYQMRLCYKQRKRFNSGFAPCFFYTRGLKSHIFWVNHAEFQLWQIKQWNDSAVLQGKWQRCLAAPKPVEECEFNFYPPPSLIMQQQHRNRQFLGQRFSLLLWVTVNLLPAAPLFLTYLIHSVKFGNLDWISSSPLWNTETVLLLCIQESHWEALLSLRGQQEADADWDSYIIRPF